MFNKIVEEIRQVVGRVIRIGNDEKQNGKIVSTRNRFKSETTGKEGLNIEVCELSTGLFWQLTVFGEVSFAELDGYTLSVDENGEAGWTQTHPALEVGQLISAKGPWTLRKYVSKVTNKPAEKNSLRIFNYRQQVRLIEMPTRMNAPTYKAPKPPTKNRRRAS